MFYNRLKYLASRQKMQKAMEAMTVDDGAVDSGNERDLYTEGDAAADLNILKRTVINDAKDMDMIKSKLNATRKYRLDLMKIDEIDIRQEFPFFFAHPCLVLIQLDFSQQCNANNEFSNHYDYKISSTAPF